MAVGQVVNDWYHYYEENLSLSNQTIQTDTVTNIATITLSSSGSWLILCGCEWAQNSTGLRRIGISPSTTNIWGSRNMGQSILANDGATTKQQLTVFANTTESKTLYLNVAQTSGSDLVAQYPWYQVIKIAN